MASNARLRRCHLVPAGLLLCTQLIAPSPALHDRSREHPSLRGQWAGLNAVLQAEGAAGAAGVARSLRMMQGIRGPAPQVAQDQRAFEAFADRREAALVAEIATEGLTLERARELAMLQERRGAVAEAEATLREARTQFASDRELALALVRFLVRHSKAAQGMEVFEEFALQQPGDRAVHLTTASLYEDLVRTRAGLTDGEKLAYISKGIAAADRAIALDPAYADAVECKAALLAHQARLEPNPDRRQELQNEAERLRAYAEELRRLHSYF